MSSSPNSSEVSIYKVRLIIGLVAISLPFLISVLAGSPLIESISAGYYHQGSDWPRNILVGFLMAISALLFSYNGENSSERHLSNVGAVASFFVATFPAKHHLVHGLASFIMFAVLAMFCFQFYKSLPSKNGPQPYPQTKARALIYKVCGIVIILSMLVVALKSTLFPNVKHIVLYAETAGLLGFGIAWLVASHIIPVITHPNERVLFVSKPDN